MPAPKGPLISATICLAAALLHVRRAAAQGLGKMFDTEPSSNTARDFSAADVLQGWDRFTDVWFMLDMAVVLVLAVLLGAAIAYHPLSRSKASSIAELEQPKTFIMYALVGALIGLIVPHYPVMGMVIFGIGGLLRFRTEIGPAKD